MNDEHFVALLTLMMCCDPWPCSETNQALIEELATAEAIARGYPNWIEAYMQL